MVFVWISTSLGCPQIWGKLISATVAPLDGFAERHLATAPHRRISEAYDLSKFAKVHPGGAKLITDAAGMDATKIFDPIHPKERDGDWGVEGGGGSSGPNSQAPLNMEPERRLFQQGKKSWKGQCLNIDHGFAFKAPTDWLPFSNPSNVLTCFLWKVAVSSGAHRRWPVGSWEERIGLTLAKKRC